MELEDDLSWDIREDERAVIADRQFRVAQAREEEQQKIDRPAMMLEDDRSAALECELRAAAVERSRIKALEDEAFGSEFVPYYRDNNQFILHLLSEVPRTMPATSPGRRRHFDRTWPQWQQDFHASESLRNGSQ